MIGSGMLGDYLFGEGSIVPPEEDSDTVYLDLQPFGVDAYYVDADSIYLDLQASSIESAEFVEAATVNLALTPSGVEVVAHDYTDAAAIDIIFTPSGTDIYHQCKPRFRGELLSWAFDPILGFYTNWSSDDVESDWGGDLLPVEAVVNYAC